MPCIRNWCTHCTNMFVNLEKKVRPLAFKSIFCNFNLSLFSPKTFWGKLNKVFFLQTYIIWFQCLVSETSIHGQRNWIIPGRAKSTLTGSNCNICIICQKFAVPAISQVCLLAGSRMRNGVSGHKSDNAPKVTSKISSWSLWSINWSLWFLWSQLSLWSLCSLCSLWSSWSS